jgi:hypothetical protein
MAVANVYAKQKHVATAQKTHTRRVAPMQNVFPVQKIGHQQMVKLGERR